MPALPDVHHVLKVVHEGTIDAEPWAGISHWRFVTSAGELDNAEAAVIAAKFVNSWRDNIAPVISGAVTDTQVIVTDLTSATSAIGVAADGNTGDRAGFVCSPESCVLVSKTVSRRYRGGHARTYWPALAPEDTTGTNGRSIDAARVTAVTTGFQTYYSDIPPAVTTDGDANCTSFHEVQVSYHSGGVLRIVPLVDDIVGYAVQQVLATQRRRMHRH